MAEQQNSEVSVYGGDRKPKKGELVSYVMDQVNIGNYYGHTYVEQNGLWKKMSDNNFRSLCYNIFGAGIPAAHIRDLNDYFMGSHNIIPHPSNLISFDGYIWDMDTCEFVLEPVSKTFFRSPIKPNMEVEMGQNEFVRALAVGDMEVYDDIFSTLAVMFSTQKPDMVGFFFGDGSNGKSVLIDVVNKIIGEHIASINLERLTDQRDAPLINGTLANLCGENADSIIIEDSQVFKSIGSHERWSVHRMHTNDVIDIDTNPMQIFCVNNMPTFKDKSSAIIRRARIIPFKNKFVQDPTFRSRLLGNETFLSNFLGEMLLYAQKGKMSGWMGDLSKSTLSQIEEYDIARNSAKTFIDECVEAGLVGFKTFQILDQRYEAWCLDNGFTKMGIKNLRNATMKHPYKRVSISNQDKAYALEGANLHNARYAVGLYYGNMVEPEKQELSQDVQSVMDLF